MPISSFADLARLSLCPRTGTKIEAYFIYSIVLTVFIYPIVVHWGWGSGFLSAWGAATGPLFSKNDSSNGMIDFAGSGVVHMVGGFSGLMGAIVVGPRKGRFDPTTGAVSSTWYQGDKVLQSLGAFILWYLTTPPPRTRQRSRSCRWSCRSWKTACVCMLIMM